MAGRAVGIAEKKEIYKLIRVRNPLIPADK